MNIASKLTLLPIISLFAATEYSSAHAVEPISTQTLSYSCTYTSSVTFVYNSDDVDVMPRFPGGECERINFINATRRYPAEEYQNRVQGRVVCSFIVNPDGSISDAAIVRGVSNSLNEEALRVINSMPRWIAGQVNGEKVPVMQVMSINFRL